MEKRGLGDVIAGITKAIGIEPCESCKERQDILNKLFPFKKPEQLTNEEINEIIRDDVEAENVSVIFDILTHVIKWNPYQLQLIYELKNTGSTELSQLTFK
jgi:hypothetical protein